MTTVLPATPGPIGVFDSGYGGLTILHHIRALLPQYNYIYLGDNARAPYGNRSFEIVFEYTRQAVVKLFEQGCHLVIIGCNTASAKALRTIQQSVLPVIAPERRVLGIIRPTAEMIGTVTNTGHIGILATEGTVRSRSYDLEIAKFFPNIYVTSQPCPLLAAIVEAGEADSDGADFFVNKYLSELIEQDSNIDTILLGCTHYPLLISKIQQSCARLSAQTHQPITVISQGSIVAQALQDYLHRHPEIDRYCTTDSSNKGTCTFLTTERADRFTAAVSTFLHTTLPATHVDLD